MLIVLIAVIIIATAMQIIAGYFLRKRLETISRSDILEPEGIDLFEMHSFLLLLRLVLGIRRGNFPHYAEIRLPLIVIRCTWSLGVLAVIGLIWLYSGSIHLTPAP